MRELEEAKSLARSAEIECVTRPVCVVCHKETVSRGQLGSNRSTRIRHTADHSPTHDRAHRLKRWCAANDMISMSDEIQYTGTNDDEVLTTVREWFPQAEVAWGLSVPASGT